MLLKLKEMTKKNGKQQGFTLVELIIVMAILAILAGIAVPKFSDVLADSKKKAHNANVQLITQAAELYFAQDSAAAVTAYGTAAAVNKETDGLVVKGYLKEAPVNPTGGDAYTVQITAAGVVTVLPAKQ